MRLLRVQVPEFRALKDVDISFEPEFYPQVFPLGSLNGGGKSTLLQLIFVLLHCSAHKERHQFIANMLEDVIIPEGETSKLLAKFELKDGDEKFELEFTVCNDSYLQQLDINPIFNKEIVSFNLFINNQEEENTFAPSLSTKEVELKKKRLKFLEKSLEEAYVTEPVKDKVIRPIASVAASIAYNYFNTEQFISAKEQIEDEIEKIHQELNEIAIYSNSINENLKNDILKNLENNHNFYITSLANNTSLGLICYFEKQDLNKFKNILLIIQQKIFISAPPNQIYWFLTKTTRQLPFLNSENKFSYDNQLEKTKKILKNFVTFDVFSIELIVKLFESARKQDFKISVETGENGTAYKNLIDELNLFSNKKITPKFDDNSNIIGIVFKNEEGKELHPEGLSHGELKRLSIYVWLKTMPQGEKIVLFDEIENGFHPRWQRYIVDDLVEWGASNQYILATHSYQVCDGVTPAHIKELKPELFSENQG